MQIPQVFLFAGSVEEGLGLLLFLAWGKIPCKCRPIH
jgi:hypothetical protein